MSNLALQLYEDIRPLESLESFIFRTAQQASSGEKRGLNLLEVSNKDGSLEFRYDVDRSAPTRVEEWGAVGGFTVAAALTVRALYTRKVQHIVSAVQATSLAFAFGGREIPRLSRRMRESGKSTEAVLGLQGSQFYLRTGGEEVWVDLAPVTGLTVRTFRFHWEGAGPEVFYAQLEMQDGRLLTVCQTDDSLVARRLVHQLVRPIPVELTFQNVDLYRNGDRVTWELGPRLVEPGLN